MDTTEPIGFRANPAHRVRFGRGVALAWVAAAAVCPAAALAQTGSSSVSPISSSADVRVGDLRSILGGLISPDQATTPGFTFTPSIGVTELLTDNVLQRAHPRLGDLVTSVAPQLVVSGQTSRIQANASYAPTYQIYAATPRQNQLIQNFNGQSLITAVPDTLFLSLRGFGAQQSTTANAGQSTSPVLSSQNRTQIIGFSASPYATHRFGGDGTAQIGYVYNYSQQTGSASGANTTLPSLLAQNSLIPSALNNNLGQTYGNATTQSNEEYASYTTGENLGRFNDSIRIDATQLQGTGVLSNARRTTAINSVGYGLNRTVALLGSFGYEDINYAGLPPVRIRDATYSAGFRLTPNETSKITVTYGHKDGFNAAALSASYQVTARLRVFANYSEGLSSSQQEIQDNLSNSTVDQFGNSLDSVTGAPVLINDQLLGLQNSLYRLKRFSSTAALTYDVDLFSLNVVSENRRVLSASPGQLGISDQGTIASVSWTHSLTPAVSLTTSLQYGVSTSQTTPVTTQSNATLVLQTAYALSQTLSATGQYYVSSLSSNLPSQSFTQNVILVGLRKSF